MALKVSTISPELSFLPELAAGIFEMAGGMGPDLTRFRILLPTRRACRELQKEFLNLSGGKPLLLPRMNPLGDIDQEELDLMIAGTIESTAIDIIPPALSNLERQMMLTALVQKKHPDMRGEQCLSLARALGRLMDQVYTEDLNLASLPSLVMEENLSVHWQESVEFLKILSEAWPLILEQEGSIDQSDRRNRLLKLLASFWEDNPPSTPIIAAGSTGSIPATGNLLRVIAGLPQGHVILPGLDLEMDDKSWENIGENHPQNTMRRLLNHMELPRHHVTPWRGRKHSESQRLETARAATCPAETCDSFNLSAESLQKGLQHVSLIEADNARHEAQLIALAVRECLEIPDRSAVIITPDRNLARRISASLKRWDIMVDDSAGQPLHMKPAGIFISKILTCLTENFAPVALLDLLKTPYGLNHYGGAKIAALEIHALRGPRPAEGIEGLKAHLAALPDTEELTALVTRIEHDLAPLLDFTSGLHSIHDLIPPLTETAERIAGGRENLWTGPDADCLSGLLSELQSSQHHLPPADLSTHKGYLNQFMSERMVRSAYGTHPRVTILGQIEARLIRGDLMILAGLNEGTWPPEPAIDPWMSRPMRSRFELPPVERQTGLSAHDFVQAFCAGRVILTRARKMDGAPTVPARWLERLSALLKNAGLEKTILAPASDNSYVAWLKELDRPLDITPVSIPDPRPKVEDRPKKLGVTAIEKLIRNPYRVYAQYILGLKPLDPIDQDVSAADRGEFVHHILNEFVKAYPRDLPANSEAILLKMGQDYIDAMSTISPEWRYWWPRFQNLVPEFIAHERNWRILHKIWQTEIEGKYDFTFSGHPFTLKARADRIDSKDGGAAIIDYKTGEAPAARDVVRGRSPQLPLEAMLLARGAFGDTPVQENVSLNYWALTGKAEPLEIVDLSEKTVTQKRIPVVIEDLIAEAEDGFARLMTAFMSEITPYYPVIPEGDHLYEEEKAYKHLARCDEWGIAGDAEQDDAA